MPGGIHLVFDHYRSTRPLKIGDHLRAFMKASGLQGQVRSRKWVDLWTEVVGDEIAEQTCVAALRRTVLEVDVSSAALVHELTAFYKRVILSALRNDPRGKGISDIRFRLAKGA